MILGLFFFKQKTAYEMRISDWSSDVCSSDLDAVDVETWSQVGDERLPAEGAERGVTVIGTGGMYPEIENALVGMAKGDEKTVDVTFPADWRVAQLAGKSAQVHVKIEQVSEQVLPEADEAFIR